MGIRVINWYKLKKRLHCAVFGHPWRCLGLTHEGTWVWECTDCGKASTT
jgi:hypothetical protein